MRLQPWQHSQVAGYDSGRARLCGAPVGGNSLYRNQGPSSGASRGVMQTDNTKEYHDMSDIVSLPAAGAVLEQVGAPSAASAATATAPGQSTSQPWHSSPWPVVLMPAAVAATGLEGPSPKAGRAGVSMEAWEAVAGQMCWWKAPLCRTMELASITNIPTGE